MAKIIPHHKGRRLKYSVLFISTDPLSLIQRNYSDVTLIEADVPKVNGKSATKSMISF